METQIWDMDGTLTTSNCFYRYVRNRLLSSPVRLARAAPVLWGMRRAPSHDAKAEYGHRIAGIALGGMSLERYHTEARAFGAALAHSEGWMRPEAVAHIQDQYNAGVHIVIATACERELAHSVLMAAGVPYHVLSATGFSEIAGAIVVSDPRDGARKTQALLDLGVPLQDAQFITDDFSDHPTAARCRDVVLVAPSAQTVQDYARAGIAASTAPWAGT